MAKESEGLHIAMVGPWDLKGGIASYVESLATALEERGIFLTRVPLTAPDSKNPLRPARDVDSIPADTDLVHVQYEASRFGRLGTAGVGAPYFFARLSRGPWPVVTTLHEVHSRHSHRGSVGDAALRTRDTAIERCILHTSEASIVHTREAKGILARRHGQSTYQIVRLLHPARADAETQPMERAKRELGIEGPLVLTFGWVEEKKRYADVIQALSDLPKVTYLIAGEPRYPADEKYLERILNVARRHSVNERVHCYGYVPDESVTTVFSAADAVVLPYDRVAQSGVVNQAFAYRRPVVASSLPSFEELQSEFGCLLTYDDSQRLSSVLRSVLYDETVYSSLRDAMDRYIESNSWEAFGEETVRLYEEIVDRRSDQGKSIA